MKTLLYLGTFVFGFLGVLLACSQLEQALVGGQVDKALIAVSFIFLLAALACWQQSRVKETDGDETGSPASTVAENDGHAESRSIFVLLARTGMVISLVTTMLVILFYGLLLPVLDLRPGSSWPWPIACCGYTLLAIVPIGFVLSGLGLCGLRREQKGILGPGLTGMLLSLLIGIPFCSSFVVHQVKPGGTASPAAATVTTTFTATPAAHFSSAAPAPAKSASHGAGTFIPAPERVDMIHDPKRNLLYITAGDSVLRYQLASNAFLPPLVLGGNLRGLDLSPDGNCLAVADGDGHTGRIGIYLVDLNTGTNSRVTFPAQNLESGAYSIAFGADGAVWITTSLNGSGFVPLRKFNPATQNRVQVQTVSQDTMLAPSADHQVIGFAEGGISSGDYGRIRNQFPSATSRANAFIYEIGVSRDGTQLAVPTYQGVLLSGGAVPRLDEPQVVGVAYHPRRDYIFLACGGSSVVAVYDTKTGAKIKELDFGDKFDWTGNHAFQSGRLRTSANGAWLFCTVNGGIRCVATGVN